MLIFLLGKHDCKEIRRNCSENNVVMKERDYAEALKAEIDTETHSEAFVFNRTLSI